MLRGFLQSNRKSITLMGMSGVGKTYLSALLEKDGWARYSCDYEIGNTYLARHLPKGISSAQDISPLSQFIGKLGNPALGGLSLAEFKKRQNYYYEAECAAISAVPDFIRARTHQDFVHDSTGSLCEIMDESLLENLGKETFFVYIKAGEAEEKIVLQRAQDTPKPLFFPPQQFDAWVDEYLSLKSLDQVEKIVPDDFARWVFPKLFAARLPKYQRLADLYGVTIACHEFKDVKNAPEFEVVITEALGK